MSRYQFSFSTVIRMMAILFFVGNLLGLSACGDSSITIRNLTLVRHSKTTAITASNQGIVTVSCSPGEHLVSGGFAQFGDINMLDIHQELLAGSFPSDPTGMPLTTPTAWTVRSGGNVNETITVFANCLKTSLPVQVTTVTSEQTYMTAGPFTQKASCPSGTTRASGGVRVDGPSFLLSNTSDNRIGAMYPSGTQDWIVQGNEDNGAKTIVNPVTVDVYAVCITTSVFAESPLASTSFTIPPLQVATTTACPTEVTIPSNCDDDQRVNGTVACPSGQLLIGGGFSDITTSLTPGVPFNYFNFAAIYGDTAQGDEASWLVQFDVFAYLIPGQPGGQGSATLWAVCVKPFSKSNHIPPTPTPTIGTSAETSTPIPPPPPPTKVATPTILPTATPAPRPTTTPTIKFTISPVSVQQKCPIPPPNSVPNTTLVLDNTGSNMAVAWTTKAVDLLPNSSILWATTSPASGTVSAGQKATVTLIPDPNICAYLTGVAPYTFHIVFTYAGNHTIAVTDSVTPFFVS